MKVAAITIGIAMGITAGGCKSSSSSVKDAQLAPLKARVDVSAGFLSPEVVRVQLGGTVQWINMDNQAHHLVSGASGGSQVGVVFDSDVIIGAPGFQPFRDFSVTFSVAGDVSYFCSTHAGTLIGKVVVVP